MLSKDNIAILVLSCDKYSDVWPAFYSFFLKYWADCPFKVYHGSNYLGFDHPKVTSLHSNQETDWSTETRSILNQISEDYVIILLEDYFMYKPVDNKALLSALEIMKEQDALFMKIACWPTKFNVLWHYQVMEKFPFIGKIEQGNQYKVCLQTGAWNRKLMMGLMQDGENPWQFELNGSKRADSLTNPCLCLVEDPHKNYTHGPITYLCTALSKGVWMRDAIELCGDEKVKIDTGSRKVETRFEYFFRRLYTRTPLSKRKYLDYIKVKFFKFQY